MRRYFVFCPFNSMSWWLTHPSLLPHCVLQVLDLIEDASASAQILDFKVGKDRSTPTEMRIQLFTAGAPEE